MHLHPLPTPSRVLHRTGPLAGVLVGATLVALLASSAVSRADTLLWEGELPSSSANRIAVLEGVVPGAVDVFLAYTSSFSKKEVLYLRAGPGQPTTVLRLYVDPDAAGGRSFGESLTNVGDVNGDGHDDLAISARGGLAGEPSSLHLYWGGPLLDDVPDHTIERPQETSPFFGLRVIGGGDLDGDGFDDFAVGVRVDDVWRAQVFRGGSPPASEPFLELIGVELGSTSFSISASMRHDVDGDGHVDLVGSADDHLKVFRGGPALDDVADLQLDAGFGVGSLAIGDVDEDGFDDVLAVATDGLRLFLGGPGLDGVADATITPRALPFEIGLWQRLALHRRAPGEAVSVLTGVRLGGPVLALMGLTGNDEGRLRWAVPFPNATPTFTDDPAATMVAGFDTNGNGLEEFVIVDGDRVELLEAVGFDCNGDGVDDAEQIAAGLLPDCDDNGVADDCQVTQWPATDCNGDGAVDVCQLDSSLDCDDNGLIDSCELEDDVQDALDCNFDGVLDACLPPGPEYDLDGDGTPDCRQIAENPGLDCNRNGTLDVVEVDDPMLDCDGNGIRDLCEIGGASWKDCNDDLSLDVCQVADARFDCDRDGTIDVCEDDAEFAADCDGSGFSDVCEMRDDFTLDCDADGFVDSCAGEAHGLPCVRRPYVGVYFDAAYTVDSIDATQLTQTDEVYVVLRNVEPSRAQQIERWELRVTMPPEFVAFGAELSPAGAADLNSAANDWYVSTNGPLSVDGSGDVQLLRLPFLVSSAVSGPVEISVQGSAASEVSTGFPVFVDAAAGAHRVLDARSAWVDRGFADCNHNGVDDATDIANGFSVDLEGDGIPDECQTTSAPPSRFAFALHPAVPNPFNPRTTVAFTLASASVVELAVHDLSGRRVRTLLDDRLDAGRHERVWNGRDDHGVSVGSGVYFVRLASDAGVRTQKLVLLR